MSKSNGRYTPPDPIAQRAVIAIMPGEMLAIAAMHRVAQRYDIVLACERCSRPFFGHNNGAQDILSISCNCRELRAQMRTPGAAA